jgi:transposase
VGGLLPGSCIPPLPLQEVRDLARYRGKTVQARAFEVRRPGTSRDSAGRMLGSAASGITGTGPTAMIEALVDGERRGAVLADRAGAGPAPRGSWRTCRWRGKAGFTGHRALMGRLILDRVVRCPPPASLLSSDTLNRTRPRRESLAWSPHAARCRGW